MKTMKENWICPDAKMQRFAPQKYVAVCMEQETTLPPGEYKLGWCIRDATGSNLIYAQADEHRDGWFLEAPSGYTAGQPLSDITKDITSTPGSFVETNYPNYLWLDLYNAGRGYLSAGDKIQLTTSNGDVQTFTVTGNSDTVLAEPKASYFSVTNHS